MYLLLNFKSNVAQCQLQLRENIPTQQGPAVLGKTSIARGIHAIWGF